MVAMGILWLALTPVVSKVAAAHDAKREERPDPQRLLLAKSWDPSIDPTGWWISEKYDGVRAHWDGKRLWTRGGNPISAP